MMWEWLGAPRVYPGSSWEEGGILFSILDYVIDSVGGKYRVGHQLWNKIGAFSWSSRDLTGPQSHCPSTMWVCTLVLASLTICTAWGEFFWSSNIGAHT
jgi:hypothetical protein